MSQTPEITPVHQWTNGGSEVLVLRFSDANGKAYGGFQHPLNVGEKVTAPDWSDINDCGGGCRMNIREFNRSCYGLCAATTAWAVILFAVFNAPDVILWLFGGGR